MECSIIDSLNAETAFLTAYKNRDDVVVLFWLKKENHDNQNHSIICFVSRRSNETEYFLMLSKSV